MARRRYNLAVGVTGLLGLIGLAALLLLFGYMPSLLERGYEVTVALPNSGGLAVGSRVRMADLDIGRVSRVSMVDPADPYRGVVVVARVRDEYRIPSDVEVSVRATSPLGGSPVLGFKIISGREPAAPLLPVDGTGVLKGKGPRGIEESLVDQLTKAMDPLSEQFGKLVEDFSKLSAEWTAVGENLRVLTKPLTPDQVDVAGGAGNLSSTIARLDQRLAEMKAVIKGIDTLINDPKLRSDIDATLGSIRSASGKIDSAAGGVEQLTGQAGKAIEDARMQIERLATRYYSVADDLSEAVRAAEKLVKEATEGEGTIGQLVKNPSLYENLDDAAVRAGKAVEELKQLLEKIKQEGLPLR